MTEFDINQYMKKERDPRPFGIVLPHMDSARFTLQNHEREYPSRLDIPLGWGFRNKDAYDIYRCCAIGYCDIRENLSGMRFDNRWDSGAAIAFKDSKGMFWFHFSYMSTCIVDEETLIEAELLYKKCDVYKSRYKLGEKLTVQEIIDGDWAWQPGIDIRTEPLYLDEAVRLDNGAWVNRGSL